MTRPLTTLLPALALALSGGRADAAFLFTATLTTSQENPPVFPTLDDGVTPRPESFGFATFVLNDALTELTISATIFNLDFGRVTPQGTVVPPPNPNPQTAGTLNDDVTLGHIHRGPVGVNGPVIFGFVGTPFNDNNPNDVVVTPFASGVGGTITSRWNVGEGNGTTLADELSNLFAGNTYINIHSVQFPGGEVRGQILPAVPEPSGLALLGVGAALVGAARRRRKVAA